MKYMDVAQDIAKLINDGTLRPGDILPSVRVAAQQKQGLRGLVWVIHGLKNCVSI